MSHIIHLVLEWALIGLAIAAVAVIAGFAVRAIGKREWSNALIIEGAFAIGVVMGFVVLVFAEVVF